MFVGLQRQAAVDRLLTTWEEVKQCQPRMVFLSGPMGWGKTRIVQEFYARLAASEGNQYWPPTIVATVDPQDVSLLTAERKRLSPDSFIAVGEPPYIWLSSHADPSEFSRPENAYRALVEQLEPHLQPILRRKRLTRAAASTVWKSLTSFIPIPADVATYLDVGGAVKDFVSEWRTGRGSERVVGAAPIEEHAANFRRLLLSVWGEDGKDGPPIVLAIEDSQFISETSAELIRALLTSNLPVLIITAGWPASNGTDSRQKPFADLINSQLSSVRVDALAELGQSEMASLVRAWHPGSPEDLVQLLVRRTLGNPYALRLALIRLGAQRGAPIDATPDRVRRMPFDIHAQFEALLWNMPDPARLGLAATALIGYRLPREMAQRGVSSVPHADLATAISTDWLRPDHASAELLAFLEPLRHEVAHTYAQQHFAPEERRQVLASGLSVVRRLLADDMPDPDRALLYELHLSLAQGGIESDIAGALISTSSLLAALRTRQAKSTIRDIVSRGDTLLPHCEVADARASYAVERARSLRYTNTRADPSTGEAVTLALQEVASIRTERPDLQIRALLEKARLHRSIDVPGQYDLSTCRAALDEAMHTMDVERLWGTDLEHDVRLCEYGTVSAERDRGRAADLALLESRRTQLPDGTQTLYSLESLADAAWYASRAGRGELAVDLSRQAVRLRAQFWGNESHPRVAAAQKDLAIRIVRLDREDLLPEAYQLCSDAYRTVETAYGPEDTLTLNALSGRGYTGVRWGVALHNQGRVPEGADLFAQGLRDADHVLEIRRRRWPRSDFLLAHERLWFAKALNGDAAAIDQLLELFDRRRNDRKQGPSIAEVRWLVADIRRAMEFHGQVERSSEFGASYPAGPTPAPDLGSS